MNPDILTVTGLLAGCITVWGVVGSMFDHANRKPKAKSEKVKVGTIVKAKLGRFEYDTVERDLTIKGKGGNTGMQLVQQGPKLLILVPSVEWPSLQGIQYYATIDQETAERTTLNMLDLFRRLELKIQEAKEKEEERVRRAKRAKDSLNEIVKRTLASDQEVEEAM